MDLWHQLKNRTGSENYGTVTVLILSSFPSAHVTNKTLAITCTSCVSCTQYSEAINSNPVTLKSRLTVTQDHSNWYHSKVWVGYGFLFAFHSNYGAVGLASII